MKDNEFIKEFGFQLKLGRLKQRITQAQLGEMVEISEHRISQIENGKCNITLKTVNRLASALNIPSAKLFNFDET